MCGDNSACTSILYVEWVALILGHLERGTTAVSGDQLHAANALARHQKAIANADTREAACDGILVSKANTGRGGDQRVSQKVAGRAQQLTYRRDG